jgi:hypothetical protein
MHRGDGLFSAAKGIGRSLLHSICSYQIQEVRGRMIRDQDPFSTSRENENTIECVVVEPGESLKPLASEFSLPFRDSLASLEKRLSEGCTLFFLRRNKKDGDEREIVGYSVAEVGGFSSVGISGKLPKDTQFVHYSEVTAKYRGQRIAQLLTKARYEYCRKHGIKKSCTTHTPSNISSERAFRKAGSRLLCHTVRVSLFRGLVVWHTPWKKIERAIGRLNEEPVRGSKFEVPEKAKIQQDGSGFEVSGQVEVEKSEQVEVKAEL